MVRIRLQARAHRNDRPFWHLSVRQVKFPATVEANFIRAVFNREHAAEVTMPAPKDKLEDVHQEFHTSCARWRRSQLPFASSHSRSERTLARARAIAQSAAP
jgi:hypothetical protein